MLNSTKTWIWTLCLISQWHIGIGLHICKIQIWNSDKRLKTSLWTKFWHSWLFWLVCCFLKGIMESRTQIQDQWTGFDQFKPISSFFPSESQVCVCARDIQILCRLMCETMTWWVLLSAMLTVATSPAQQPSWSMFFYCLFLLHMLHVTPELECQGKSWMTLHDSLWCDACQAT